MLLNNLVITYLTYVHIIIKKQQGKVFILDVKVGHTFTYENNVFLVLIKHIRIQDVNATNLLGMLVIVNKGIL